MKKSLEEALSTSLGRARIGCLLQPQELMTQVPSQSNFAKRPTMALRLSPAEFNEIDGGALTCATGLLQFGDVLFALLAAGTQSHCHLGVMDMANPACYSAVLQCAKSGAVNIGVTNADGEHRLRVLKSTTHLRWPLNKPLGRASRHHARNSCKPSATSLATWPEATSFRTSG